MLQEKHGFDAASTSLIFKSKKLSDDQLLLDCGIDSGSFIILFSQKVIKKPKSEPNINQQQLSQVETNKEEQENKQNETSEYLGPQDEPLPLFVQKFDGFIPENFDEMVKNLQEATQMSQIDCENALRAALFKPDYAAQYLFSGHIPDPSRMTVPILSDYEYSDEEEDYGSIRELLTIKNQLQQNPQLLPQIMEKISALEGRKVDPFVFLQTIGLNPSDFNVKIEADSEYEKSMQQFTSEEREMIHRLEKKENSMDSMTIIQVFLACEKNEELTASCLSSMREK
ncbi:Ubiquitin family protein [Histomonas meleagridis]|uniref:Ubiquitin family protein n=1 Tax=Histomonas meleagridis TaxID=135588 RepID=UPI00355A202D|nr:Ubiquitin family protein [Histomonas meleagridis]KAH0805699.1 Ubiquitin family protein [Histomonas meleagridis]